MSSETWQGTATAEEYINFPNNPANPDRRRFVNQQNNNGIFQVEIRKKCGCCKDAFGSCFLAKVNVTGGLQLNTDPKSLLVYLLTAAHNLYCRRRGKYAESIDLVQMKPAQFSTLLSLLKQPVTCGPPNGGHGSFFRVPDDYKTFKTRHEAQTRDFGIICVARNLFNDPQLVASTFLNLQGPVKELYPQASVCGFPLYIIRNLGTGIDIPNYTPDSHTKPKLKQTVPGCSSPVDRFCVAGALYEMPAQPLTLLAANGSMQERKVAERKSVGLFAFPQNHFDELAPDIVYRTNGQCHQWLYRHYIDTSPGQSGSPVYIVDNAGNATVVGIHIGVWYYSADVHGHPTYNQDTDCNIAIRLTDRMLTEVIHLTTK